MPGVLAKQTSMPLPRHCHSWKGRKLHLVLPPSLMTSWLSLLPLKALLLSPNFLPPSSASPPLLHLQSRTPCSYISRIRNQAGFDVVFFNSMVSLALPSHLVSSRFWLSTPIASIIFGLIGLPPPDIIPLILAWGSIYQATVSLRCPSLH